MANSKKAYQWMRGCLRKKRYRTFDYASGVVDKIMKGTGQLLQIYYCKDCLGFHLTKSTTHPATVRREL